MGKPTERDFANITHLENDELRCECKNRSLLYSIGNTLRTANSTNIADVWKGGQSTAIYGFIQINSTHVTVIDNGRHCVIMIDRSSSNSVTEIAGICGRPGSARNLLSNPYGVVLDGKPFSTFNRLVISDSGNHAIKAIDLETLEQSIVINTGLKYPRSMVWYKNQTMLLVSNIDYIVVLNMDKNGTAAIGRPIESASNGGTAKFQGLGEIMYLFQPGLFLAADFQNGTLHLIDMERRLVLPVCISDSCNSSTPVGSKPIAMLRIRNEVWIATETQLNTYYGL